MKERIPRRFVSLAAALLATALVAVIPDAARAVHVACGDTVTQDTTLDSDLVDCPGDGIVIGADGITLDLNGHTVDGDGDPRGVGCDTGVVNGRFDACQEPFAGHDGVTMRGGTVREFAHGVQVIEAAQNTLLQLQLYDNTGFGGIATYLMSDGRIAQNRAFGNRSAGIAVYEPTGRTTIAGNVVGRNAGWGIELAGSAPGDSFEGNVAYGNAGAGFFFFSARHLLIQRNRSSGNRGQGMLLADGSRGNHVEGNRIWGNAFSGIALHEGSHENRLERNFVSWNARAVPVSDEYGGGIVVGAGDANQVSGNRVVGNGGKGGVVISAERGGHLIAGNDSHRNRGDGIHVLPERPDLSSHVPTSTISRNRTDGNGDDGIDVDSDDIFLSTNRAVRNLDLGIAAVAGVTDGHGNRAHANGNPLQCVNVFCR